MLHGACRGSLLTADENRTRRSSDQESGVPTARRLRPLVSGGGLEPDPLDQESGVPTARRLRPLVSGGGLGPDPLDQESGVPTARRLLPRCQEVDSNQIPSIKSLVF